MVAVSKIYRYPIKGLSAQPLSSVVARGRQAVSATTASLRWRGPGAPIDRNDPKWAKKGLFVMLMLDENLARVNTSLDLDSLRLTVRQGNQQVAAAQLDDEADRDEDREFLLAIAADVAGAAGAGPLGRRPFHGQAGQRHLA